MGIKAKRAKNDFKRLDKQTVQGEQTVCLPYHYLSTLCYHFPPPMRLQLILSAALQFSDSKRMLIFVLRPWEHPRL